MRKAGFGEKQKKGRRGNVPGGKEFSRGFANIFEAFSNVVAAFDIKGVHKLCHVSNGTAFFGDQTENAKKRRGNDVVFA